MAYRCPKGVPGNRGAFRFEKGSVTGKFCLSLPGAGFFIPGNDPRSNPAGGISTAERKEATLMKLINTTDAVGHVPVSYTHLDVYKRQVYGLQPPEPYRILVSSPSAGAVPLF